MVSHSLPLPLSAESAIPHNCEQFIPLQSDSMSRPCKGILCGGKWPCIDYCMPTQSGHLCRTGYVWREASLQAAPVQLSVQLSVLSVLSATVGLSDCRNCRTTVGLSDMCPTVHDHLLAPDSCRRCRTSLSDCRTVGLSDCRTVGLSATVGYCRIGLSDCRTGAQVHSIDVGDQHRLVHVRDGAAV